MAMRPKGYLSICEWRDENGVLIPNQDAVDHGFVLDPQRVPGWCGAPREEIGLGYNLFTDAGLQALTYALGNTSPITNYVCTQFGAGIGTIPPNVLDVGLSNPVPFTTNGSNYLKAVGAITFPAPFVMQVSMPFASSDCNGYLLTEFGLFTANGTLLNHKTSSGVNKTSAASPTLMIRFRL